jgi:LacI family transcriptional regulator
LVRSNNQEAMCEATRHLLSHGYREIGFINGPAEISVAQERLAGYMDALREASLIPRSSLIIHSNFRQEGGHAAMCQLLNLSKPPRAVLIGNNLMTLGALQAIDEQGLQIPDEIGVLGFDDMPWATSLRPPLTAVAQPAEEIGRTAAQLLMERLNDPGRIARQVILPATLVVRASCGAHSPALNGSSPSCNTPRKAERPIRVGSGRSTDPNPAMTSQPTTSIPCPKEANVVVNPILT